MEAPRAGTARGAAGGKGRPRVKPSFMTETECRGSTLLITVTGDLDTAAAPALRACLWAVAEGHSVVMIDLHGVPFMDTAGLLLLLDVHRRAECLGLRVLVVGWQRQPQELMAEVARIPGPGSATGERYGLASFRRLVEQRARVRRGETVGVPPLG